ncbi:endocuticle structural glycoprotein SgAbd-2-like isoform X2 [Arctopsyche grandis]|uniref:endocuticle structural glycoprotein SgAbd-2-like isoform X2 n=1 Tax=Arctopsyche grandis TaxID=121162 RepID=UPI00406D707F
MKVSIVLLFGILAVNSQRISPYNSLKDVPIIKYNNEQNVDGSYRYNYETGNGIRAQEDGFLKNKGSQLEAQVMQGSYSYTGPDGVLYTITYIADENGYRAQGAHIPTPPPIPKAIQDSIAYNAAHPEPQGRNY